MARNPYTTAIINNLGIDAANLRNLAETHGFDSPIGQCADMIQSTIWEMQSAERAANDAVNKIREAAEQQAGNLTGTAGTYDASWLTTYAQRANEANQKITAGIERLTTFKRLLDVLLTNA
ncbi:hypothetical protein E1211_28945 [Micromonospora sp. 15K316]|uniref:hypothetical protein n=1 Tax=Micromonospora sp. 15K316 TaxID=2530376 RepID=UPI001043E295|nr:hypothetical protein [Micromonospora sp. 15K316]TDC27650.1 hypothetical protein E1211_28945 [Micromonospora sp. 15K316]